MRSAAGAADRIARAIQALERPRLSKLTKHYVVLDLKEVLEYLEGLIEHPKSSISENEPWKDGDIY